MTHETPMVHLNGTGFKDLWNGYEKADDALFGMIESFGQIEFNARDYYVKGPESWGKARDERCAINLKLKEIQCYLNAIRGSLDEQRKP